MENVHVHVSYCGPCGFKTQFEEMSNIMKQRVPNVHLTGEEDERSGAFEVAINGKTVHSRLSNFSFPDFNATAEVVERVKNGESIPNKLKEQPITDCHVS